ncbi:hypothetical protein [Hymenobacter koreensis]|uniref:Uncharacterized protein n=1 Tax=Hymenobacter koreensis TaxID=1084523 RepID=A0ABP8JMW6_9BACT
MESPAEHQARAAYRQAQGTPYERCALQALIDQQQAELEPRPKVPTGRFQATLSTLRHQFKPAA